MHPHSYLEPDITSRPTWHYIIITTNIQWRKNGEEPRNVRWGCPVRNKACVITVRIFCQTFVSFPQSDCKHEGKVSLYIGPFAVTIIKPSPVGWKLLICEVDCIVLPFTVTKEISSHLQFANRITGPLSELPHVRLWWTLIQQLPSPWRSPQHPSGICIASACGVQLEFGLGELCYCVAAFTCKYNKLALQQQKQLKKWYIYCQAIQFCTAILFPPVLQICLFNPHVLHIPFKLYITNIQRGQCSFLSASVSLVKCYTKKLEKVFSMLEGCVQYDGDCSV